MKLQEMTWPAVAALSKDVPVVVPIAALEQHGRHLPVFTDSMLLGEVVRRASERLGDRVRHAGAIFLGRYAPEAIGDYVAGSNHVLPTSRSARFSSGLSIYDFLKRSSIIRCDAESFARLAGPTIALAEAEGLPAHARSAAIRLNR